MIIQKIDIHNFGPFYGRHEIELQGDGKGVYLLRGGNGQGKTSFQRAILWALYGKVADRNGQMIRPTSLLNHNSLAEDKYEFSVTLFFEHQGAKWSLFRKMSARYHNDGRYNEGMVLNLIKDGQIIQESQQEIERILPYHVSRFYFFDGEMLRDYEALLEQDPQATRLLRDSIEYVLGVPYLKTAREDILAIRNKFEKERNRLMRRIKSGDVDLDALAENYQGALSDIAEKEGLIKKLEEDEEALRNGVLNKKRDLANLREVQELAQKRLLLDSQVEKLESNKERFLERLQNLTSSIYINILSPVAENLAKQIDIKLDVAYRKFSEKQHLIEASERMKNNLSSPFCIYCKAPLNEEKLSQIKKEFAEVEEKIELMGEIEEPDLELKYLRNKLNNLIHSIKSRDEFENISKSIKEIDYELAKASTQLKDIEDKLQGVDSEEPRNLEIAIQNSVQELGRLEGLEASARSDLAELIKLKGEWERLMASIPQSEINSLNKKISAIDPIADIFDDAISVYRDYRRQTIESIASEIFKKIRSKEDFDRLIINEHYGLSIITRNGTKLDRSEWRSSGEEQLVALSLIGALNKCAETKAPVIMDTPLGRFDIKHGERVISFLPSFADQVILLVTDREFREGDEMFLEGKIKGDLSIKYKGEREGSCID
jgi:DNA sulfur modification protein DndD